MEAVGVAAISFLHIFPPSIPLYSFSIHAEEPKPVDWRAYPSPFVPHHYAMLPRIPARLLLRPPE